MEVYCKIFLSYEEWGSISIENYKIISVSHGTFSPSSSAPRPQWLVWHPQKQCRCMDVGKNSRSIGRSTYQNRIMYHWTFCGKTDGGTIIFILTVAYPTLCPFSPKSAVLKRRSFCSILLSYDAREENICAYTQQNWRGKIEPCTKMSSTLGEMKKSSPVQPAF